MTLGSAMCHSLPKRAEHPEQMEPSWPAMFLMFRMFRSPWEGVAASMRAITARVAMALDAPGAGKLMQSNHIADI